METSTIDETAKCAMAAVDDRACAEVCVIQSHLHEYLHTATVDAHLMLRFSQSVQLRLTSSRFLKHLKMELGDEQDEELLAPRPRIWATFSFLDREDKILHRCKAAYQ